VDEKAFVMMQHVAFLVVLELPLPTLCTAKVVMSARWSSRSRCLCAPVVVVLHGVQGKQKVAVCVFVKLCVVLELPEWSCVVLFVHQFSAVYILVYFLGWTPVKGSPVSVVGVLVSSAGSTAILERVGCGLGRAV
jgi:hypothetical protein